MEKAYDMSALVAKVKARGMDVAEDAAKGLVEDMFGWVEESVQLSATPYDDMALVILPKLKEFALSQADKIDGVEG